MRRLKITEDESAPQNTARIEAGRLIVSPEMMNELREFMQQDTGDLDVVSVLDVGNSGRIEPYQIKENDGGWIVQKHGFAGVGPYQAKSEAMNIAKTSPPER